jgi:hypothetical protein
MSVILPPTLDMMYKGHGFTINTAPWKSSSNSSFAVTASERCDMDIVPLICVADAYAGAATFLIFDISRQRNSFDSRYEMELTW